MVEKHLITGITGQDGVFLTSHIINNKKDDLIYGFSRNENIKTFQKKLQHTLGNNLDINNVKIINNVDLLNEKDVAKLIKEIMPDYIYNLSGPSSVYKSMQKGDKTDKTIIKIFNNLIKPVINENLKCNFFQASSSEMFDASLSPLNEQSKFLPRSPYAEAKLYIHEDIQKIKNDYEVNISSGIMFNHESEFRDDEYLIMKIINSAISIEDKDINEFKVGSLELVRDWSHAKDIALAIYEINKEGASEDYVIGSGVGNNIETILEIVFTFFNLNWKDFVKIDNSLLREGDPLSIVSNPKKIKDRLNWKSMISLEETLIKCIEFKKSKRI